MVPVREDAPLTVNMDLHVNPGYRRKEGQTPPISLWLVQYSTVQYSTVHTDPKQNRTVGQDSSLDTFLESSFLFFIYCVVLCCH
jgi:hypothetical protein